MSTPCCLKAPICAEKSLFMFWKRPGSTSRNPSFASGPGKPRPLSPQALPSPSLGKRPPTVFFVCTDFHPATKFAITSSRPQKKWYVQSNPFCGSPLRPKNQGCQGTTVEMQGTSFSSLASQTGLAVSGVEETRTRSTLSFRIRSPATSPARLGLDWLSLCTI